MSNFSEALFKPVHLYRNKVQKFCDPLLTHFGINHFYYYRLLDDGQIFSVSNHCEWMERYCFDRSIFTNNPYLKTSKNFSNNAYFHELVDDESMHECLAAARKCRVFPYFQFIEKREGYTEGYGFGLVENTPQIKAAILYEMPLLKDFCLSFKKEFKSTLINAEELQVNIAKEVGPQFYSVTPNFSSQVNKKVFLKEISSELATLSPQEWSVLQQWRHGYSAKEVAFQLGLSKRTVEHYIDSIKFKLDCSTRGEVNQRFS